MRCLFHTSAARSSRAFRNSKSLCKSSSCPFAGAKKAPKRKKSSKRLSKDRAKDLAASDEGSYFEQEQLEQLSFSTKEKDKSQDDDECQPCEDFTKGD